MRLGNRIPKTFPLMLGLLLCIGSARAQAPCPANQRRALVLSGGGQKGAFQTGAIYHLVVHRGCDFHEFSGVSVGALNAAFLAQAEPGAGGGDSQARLQKQAEELVSLWDSIEGPRDIMRGRRLATLRFGLFGAESLNDFQPLRRLLDANVSEDRLSQGRPLRVGVVNFYDGSYREVPFRPTLAESRSATFMDYLFASSVIPVLGKMPRILEAGSAEDPAAEVQFGDGSLRHITPVAGYFSVCRSMRLVASLSPSGVTPDCTPPAFTRDQGPLEQLFVIVTSPYSPASDSLPVGDPKTLRRGTRQITKGPKVLNRTIDLMVNTTYRHDLDFLLRTNDMLRWRRQLYSRLLSGAAPEQVSEVKQQFAEAAEFPYESSNRDSQDPEAPSLPYEIGLVVPQKEYAAMGSLLVFSPPTIREQLYCGCVAADQMMQEHFGQESLAGRCAERFPPLAKTKTKKKSREAVSPAKWDSLVCQK